MDRASVTDSPDRLPPPVAYCAMVLFAVAGWELALTLAIMLWGAL